MGAAASNILFDSLDNLRSTPSSISCIASRDDRFRLNFITFDRILQLDLTQNWPASDAATAGAIASSSNIPNSSATSPNTPHLSSTNFKASSLGVHVVDNFLSSAECSHLIRQTRLQHSLDGEYLPSQRDSTRLLVQSPQLSSLLWNRLSSLLPEILRRHPTPLVPMGFGTFGRWEPFGINTCMRFSDYHPGSIGFTPHRDSPLVQCTCERSILTIIIYLNDVEEKQQLEAVQHESPFTPSGEKATRRLQVMDDMTASTSEQSPSGRGCTSFYRSRKFVGGCLVRDEDPEYCFSIIPKVGRAVVFPHETLHAGDPLSRYCTSKHILRTDLVFRRWEYVPLLRIEKHWRNSAEYLQAVELFQRAFKYELAGEVQQATDCYERCTSLRVAALLRSRQSSTDVFSKSGMLTNFREMLHGSVMPVNPNIGDLPSDCMRVVYRFLTKPDLDAAISTCRVWRQARPKHYYDQLGEIHLTSVVPNLYPSIPIQVKSKYHYRSSAAMFQSFLPTLHASADVDGISIIMSYPRKFYKSHARACRRAMAVYAAIMFSHALPLTQRDLKQQKMNEDSLLHLAAAAARRSHVQAAIPKDEAKMLELAATRIVLSYQPQIGNPTPASLLMSDSHTDMIAEAAARATTNRDDSACSLHHSLQRLSPYVRSQVEWCTFEDLLVNAVKGQELVTQLGTLAQFNSNVSINANPDRDDGVGVNCYSQGQNQNQHESQLVSSKRRFLFGEKEAENVQEEEGVWVRRRKRFSVAFTNLIPSHFYHAAICSNHGSGDCQPTREGPWCVEMFREDKEPRRLRRQLQYKLRSAQELRRLDEATSSQLSKIALSNNVPRTSCVVDSVNSTESAVACDSSPPPDLVTVIVQEMRTEKKIAYFRVSFIGIPAL